MTRQDEMRFLNYSPTLLQLAIRRRPCVCRGFEATTHQRPCGHKVSSNVSTLQLSHYVYDIAPFLASSERFQLPTLNISKTGTQT